MVQHISALDTSGTKTAKKMPAKKFFGTVSPANKRIKTAVNNLNFRVALGCSHAGAHVLLCVAIIYWTCSTGINTTFVASDDCTV